MDGRCEAYNRRGTQCEHDGWFDNYHWTVLCDTHADMSDPPMTAEHALAQRRERDANRDRQRSRYDTPATL